VAQDKPDPYDYMEGDPRGWYEKDHNLWVSFLNSARKVSVELHSRLYAFRIQGTAIVRNSKGNYVLRPNIDPENKVAWGSIEEYIRFRNKYLMPHAKEVALLLKNLKEEHQYVK